ncbi:MAG: SDR family NAD(P)-dependent oxidoreductase [Thermoplasmata archaeon]|nr:SDR family NAD(P)-dependent oxidoreductase [Thermoplasmata archaeon]
MANIMITGANRGIGWEFTNRFLYRGDTVIATYRDKDRSQELLSLRTRMVDEGSELLIPVQLEVRDQASIDACFDEVGQHIESLDMLINNAGMGDSSVDIGDPAAHKSFGNLEADAIVDVLAVNSVAPIMITQRFAPMMEWADNPKVVHISSKMGSIELRGDSGYYSYSASKTALNMLGRIMSHDLMSMGVISVMLHPGWVKTTMGGPEAPVSVADSVVGMMKVIDGLTPEMNGGFYDWEGQELPW